MNVARHAGLPAPRQPALGSWTSGNRLRLLENGEAFFPAVFEAIAHAQWEVLVETFILFDDDVGRELRAAAIAAAQRGVRVVITVDGYGSPDLPPEFIDGMTGSGVDFRYFDPRPRLLGFRTNALRRLHRKIVVVDGVCAFIGGINFALEYLSRYGQCAKQDYAVQIRGPLADQVRTLATALLEGRRLPRPRPWWRSRAAGGSTGGGGGVAAKLVWRDNDHHRDDIEIHYRWAIRKARHEVLIANAYFFPGYRLVRELRRAARRGVRVHLILQGRSDQPVASSAARSLYAHLMRSGVCIHEYATRPLHAKVAVIDGQWSTIGSSNLDPSSLSLNLEANLIFDDAPFGATLRARLHGLMRDHCRRVHPDNPPLLPLWRQLLGFLAFHLMRSFPGWDRWLPRRRQAVVAAAPAERETNGAGNDDDADQSENRLSSSKCAS